MKQKLFALFLALIASMSAIYAQSGTCGNNLTWNLNAETGVLTISGTGRMKDYEYSSDVPWYGYRSSIKSVIIGDGVTNIGEYAFEGCKSLTSVTIPNSVTNIGEYAFEGCKSLTSVTIPNSVTGIEYSAFSGCSSLASVTIPNSVTSIGKYAFQGCSSLTSISIPNSVASIRDYAFQYCSSLTSVTINSDAIVNEAYTSSSNISNIFGSQVTKYIIGGNVKGIGNYAFFGCSSLTSVTIGNSVTSIGWDAFSGCKSLTSITIPNSVTSIGLGAFASCKSLTSVTIPNSVTSIGYGAFRSCSSLTSITIPNSVTSIGEDAFSNCSSLTSITIPNSVTSIGHQAFCGCSSLTSVVNYATQPQAIETSVFLYVDISACQLHVPSTSVSLYQTAKVWYDFGNIQPIRAEDITDVSETIITPSENEVEITWPSVSGAASYELVIKDKDGNIVCTLIFNANGQLTSIAFNAPSRNGVPAHTQSAGFSFTITGLDSGTGYDLTLTAKDNSGNTIEETTIPFQTDYPEGIEDVPSSSLQGGDRGRLVLRDGQVLILRNGKTYTMQGQEVK